MDLKLIKSRGIELAARMVRNARMSEADLAPSRGELEKIDNLLRQSAVFIRQTLDSICGRVNDLHDAIRELERARVGTKFSRSESPGHCHKIDGVWDDDSSNGDRAGKPCDWCAAWKRIREFAISGKNESAAS